MNLVFEGSPVLKELTPCHIHIQFQMYLWPCKFRSFNKFLGFCSWNVLGQCSHWEHKIISMNLMNKSWHAFCRSSDLLALLIWLLACCSTVRKKFCFLEKLFCSFVLILAVWINVLAKDMNGIFFLWFWSFWCNQN